MKQVLVTGGCGFIGSNFIRYLLAAPDFSGEIINIDKLTYAGNPENLAGVEEAFPGRYHFVRADICDMEALEAIFAAYPVDTVCHFAAESHVDRSIVSPDAFVRTNILGTFNLLELCRRYQDRLALFHHVSTDEVYGSLGADGLFTEQTAYDPSSPYSASKAASDHLVRACHRTYGIPVTLSNCSNNYGPYQFPEKLIPLMILNALAGKKLPVYGRGENVRDWLYVTDHCRAIWTVMKQGRRGATYNIGGRCEMKNIDVVTQICDRIDRLAPDPSGRSRRELIAFVRDRPGHDLRYAIDCTRLERELGWTPAESFDSGIDRTILWYLDNPGWVRRVQSGEYRSWLAHHYGE
ncbi:dTDP-glucose 4,6-dehydratase [Desulfonema ishimotonii]|uniref:dTDP-glucose 4,6-dehydratase n=1 Tax=Desulfonema ishimotonii TaxID=45657 RepID=A0A401G0M2_9BACT|nr:dTDP-glucose 4,6-dehydratase [Desulfonema ishimotonii]GBC62769.1 dTDP-glucose 4,6-dehydratase [Desulfonema ishimotonii]